MSLFSHAVLFLSDQETATLRRSSRTFLCPSFLNACDFWLKRGEIKCFATAKDHLQGGDCKTDHIVLCISRTSTFSVQRDATPGPLTQDRTHSQPRGLSRLTVLLLSHLPSVWCQAAKGAMGLSTVMWSLHGEELMQLALMRHLLEERQWGRVERGERGRGVLHERPLCPRQPCEGACLSVVLFC